MNIFILETILQISHLWLFWQILLNKKVFTKSAKPYSRFKDVDRQKKDKVHYWNLKK